MKLEKGSAGKTTLRVGKQSLFFSQYLLCVGRLTEMSFQILTGWPDSLLSAGR